ncbi:ParA family protein [Deinococcus sonorensis]|uniref:ParA family protein n=2 Tax=Deinococcus sonorensis TaxID=309891 RepID=A0AAU7U596_9DEIO
MIVVTFFNHVGGAGKSSLTRDVGHTFGTWGLRTLLIDLDPQANLSSWLGVRGVPLERTVHDTAVDDRPLPQPYPVYGVDLIPSSIGLALAEARVLGVTGAQMHLRTHLQDLKDHYDVVLIDSPPSLGQLSVLGAIAADHLVVPVPTREKGINGIEGVLHALKSYRKLNPTLSVALFIPTLYDRRQLHDKEAYTSMEQQLSPLASPMPYRAATWNDSTSAQQPVGVYAAGSEAHQHVLTAAREIAQAIGLKIGVPRG